MKRSDADQGFFFRIDRPKESRRRSNDERVVDDEQAAIAEALADGQLQAITANDDVWEFDA